MTTMTKTRPKLTYLPATASTEVIHDVLQRDAAVIIEDVLSADQIATIREELAPYLTAADEGNNEFSGFQTRRMGALLARSPTCRELALDPTVNAMCEQFLGPHCDNYQLHFTQAISIGPGESAQPLHRDRGLWGGYIPRRIETQLSTIWAITEFTEENGATQLVPGSQTWDAQREPEPHEIVPAKMKPGSVLLYSGTVIHGGGANQTQQNRLGVLIHYALGWLRQEENQYLSCPPEIAKELKPELRDLIGYSQGGPILGFYSTPGEPGTGHELADPRMLFQ
ncbi:phytanoyl-CoA dioxygenase family protein [Alterisphingorhabdus coralli]|uniref:Phytanoyl-CoA dioxygenase family protein n=1 Tax=Alterisphingorhabdus coralli TaxID=3071408 RepID=A0AA97I0R7_9SPHN|nr:phytanoyl-CoA dioxygenase family protein [Parasphingorhabdus sp. SCSIO 66989]WOE75272.1 phytanoyl-CoA dioxygenase family protein [Parasphingorhabdus sp. SCSIO 66989]